VHQAPLLPQLGIKMPGSSTPQIAHGVNVDVQQRKGAAELGC